MPFDGLPITSPVIETLRLGRALIIERGLARGAVEDPDGRVCTVGGITRQNRARINQALDYLAKAIPADLFAIGAWNDAPDRTQADVIAAYDRAIDAAVADRLAEMGANRLSQRE